MKELRVFSAPRTQHGAVLIMGLIMLLLMTIVGLAAIRGSGLQETMAGNMRERNMAFQAAEAALRMGEAQVENNPVDNLNFGINIKGYKPDLMQPGAGLPPVAEWSEEDWSNNAVQVDFDLDNIPEDRLPYYVVEELLILSQNASRATGGAVDQASLQATNDLQMEFFRVSARGASASGQAESVVQSTYRKN